MGVPSSFDVMFNMQWDAFALNWNDNFFIGAKWWNANWFYDVPGSSGLLQLVHNQPGPPVRCQSFQFPITVGSATYYEIVVWWDFFPPDLTSKASCIF